MHTYLFSIGIAGVLMHGWALAQVPVPPSSAALKAVVFEAASIKPNTSAGAGSFVGRQPGGRFRAENATLLELIEFAYQAQPFHVTGGPAWARSDRWDVVAKLEGVPQPAPPGTPDDTVLALRTLLRDRFKLVLRPETRQLPIYALVLARPGGAPGPKMIRSAIDCAAVAATRDRNAAPPPGNANNNRRCGLRGRVGSIESIGSPLSEFAIALSARVQRTVVDRTELTGTWDFVLTHAVEATLVAPGALASGAQPPPADPDQPSLFTALQEQLGLKLEAMRGPVDVLVIARVERGSENEER